jgi:hypothetical protein
MFRTAGATVAAAGFLLLCGRALSDDAVRLPRKGSAPGFDMRYDEDRRTPRQGNGAGPHRGERETKERWEQREQRERQARLQRLERLERMERAERSQGREGHCRKRAGSARQAQESAKQKVVVGYLAGGLIGALIASSENDDAYKDPKVLWQEVYDHCMGRGKRADDDGADDDDD